ncbi:hypothetical protein [Streptomyces sp. 769]|uniref:hypothetical protein n=1 Tax=Streptomyces sp. 769 TaxID=1262452 RepID=UPI00058033CE|nr:hypothetical protein [Streptomyces sp. 769]AJC54789.1 hypothetical protein GZL_02196 [Streptomyces sp. 769]
MSGTTGRLTAKYHTPRFILVPALREDLEPLVPADCPVRASRGGSGRPRACPGDRAFRVADP